MFLIRESKPSFMLSMARFIHLPSKSIARRISRDLQRPSAEFDDLWRRIARNKMASVAPGLLLALLSNAAARSINARKNRKKFRHIVLSGAHHCEFFQIFVLETWLAICDGMWPLAPCPAVLSGPRLNAVFQNQYFIINI